MPKLRKRASRYDQLQALLYGQLRAHGTKPEDLLGCCRETAAKRLRDIDRMPPRGNQVSVNERKGKQQ